MLGDLVAAAVPDGVELREVGLDLRGQRRGVVRVLVAHRYGPHDRVAQGVGLGERVERLGLRLGRGERRARSCRRLLPVGGVVRLQGRLDLRIGDGVVEGQTLNELPAQVCVDLESVEGDRPVEQTPDGRDVRRSRGDAREELHELELRVGCRVGALREPPELVAHPRDRALAQRGVNVEAGDGSQLRNRRADRRRLGLGGDVVQHERDVVARPGLGIPCGIPGRTPHDRSCEGVVDVLEVGHGYGEGIRIEADLRVGEIVVVDKNEVGALLAHELGDLGAYTVNVDLHAVVAQQLAAAEVVEPDREAVRADGGVVGRCLLQHRERGDRAIRIGLDRRAQRVNARGLEPQLAPARQLATGGLLKLGQEVGELGVAVLVLLEVGGDAGHKLLKPDPRDQLLEHRPTLGVGDAVEVDLDVLKVVDGGHDRVRRRQLVLAVGPALLHRLERGPGLVPLGCLGCSEGRRPLREGLVEPEVVPPLHRDEVTEPHVGELVQDRDDPALLDRVGHLGAEHVRLGERDRARVLHGASVELGHKQLVVLLKRVRVGEVLLVEGETLAGLLEDVVRVEVLRERLAREDAERDHPAITRGQLRMNSLVGAGNQRGHVARENRRGAEAPARDPVRNKLGGGGGGVAHNRPVGWRRHGELERRLEVGLLEDREHPSRVRHLELRVQVHLVVDRVDEAVESLTRLGVLEVGDDLEHVGRLQPFELDARAVAHLGAEAHAVQGHGVHRVSERVDEGRGSGRRRETNNRGARERVRPGREVE